MKSHYLIMKWSYHYDKEGTWFDDDEGVYGYELKADTHFTLPHMEKKAVEILEVTQEGEVITATLKAAYDVFTVKNDGVAVTKHESDSYSAAGDSVHQSIAMTFTIEPKENDDKNEE